MTRLEEKGSTRGATTRLEEQGSTRGATTRLEEQGSTQGAESLTRGHVSRLVMEGLPLFKTSELTIGPLNGVPFRHLRFSGNERQ